MLSIVLSLLMTFSWAQETTDVEFNDEAPQQSTTLVESDGWFKFKLERVNVGAQKGPVTHAQELLQYTKDSYRKANVRSFIPSSLEDQQLQWEMDLLATKLIGRCGVPIFALSGFGYRSVLKVTYALAKAGIVSVAAIDGLSAIGDGLKTLTSDNGMDREELFPAAKATAKAAQWIQNKVIDTYNNCEQVKKQYSMYRDAALQRGILQNNSDYTFSGDFGDSGP